MARHEYTIYENATSTATTAPYLGKYQSKGTVLVGDQYERMATLSGLTAIQCQAIIEGAFNEAIMMEKTEVCRIYTDIGQICTKIGGKFASADAAFDATKNTFDVVLHANDDIRLNLVNETPLLVTDETVTRVAVNNLMDMTTPKPMNLIHGQGHFRVAGYNLVMTDTGASCYLESSAGVTYPCTVDQSISNQLFEAHTTSLIPESAAGDFKLVVKSRGGDAEGPLQTVFRKVKYLYVAPSVPTIESVVGSTVGTGKIKGGEGATITGTLLTEYTAGRIDYTNMSGEAASVNFMGISYNTAGTVGTVSSLPAMADADTSVNATLVLTTTGGATIQKGGLTIVA